MWPPSTWNSASPPYTAAPTETPTMPATMPPLIQLSPSGGGESLRMLVQHQEQAEQDQPMFLFHPGRGREKNFQSLYVYGCDSPTVGKSFEINVSFRSA